MDNKIYQDAVKEAIKRAFGRKKVLPSKAKQSFPLSAEREYSRIAGRYMKELDAVIMEILPDIEKLSREASRKDARMDGISDSVEKLFKNTVGKAAKKVADIGLESLISMIGKRVKKSAYKDWKKTVQKTLGAETDDDHYNDDFYKEILDKWVSENKELAAEIIKTSIGKIKDYVKESLKNGRKPTEIAKGIQNILKTSAEIAKQASKDQVSRLNTTIKKEHCEDAGADSYMWMTKRDSKVRDCHASLHGKVIKWDSPPEMWHINAAGAKIMDGRFCHPGEDYHCRCWAVPIFSKEKLNGDIFGQ